MGWLIAIVVVALLSVGGILCHRWWGNTRSATSGDMPVMPRRSLSEIVYGDDAPVPRGPIVDTAAPVSQPMGERSEHGTVYEEARKKAEAYGLGTWLFVDVDERLAGGSPLGEKETGYWVRITQDSGIEEGYAVERVPADRFLRRQSGQFTVSVFFASPKTEVVTQGTSKVTISPPGPDLERLVPLPAEAIEPIARVPMTSTSGRFEVIRLARQLSQAQNLPDDDQA